jgi:hypothetical protein
VKQLAAGHRPGDRQLTTFEFLDRIGLGGVEDEHGWPHRPKSPQQLAGTIHDRDGSRSVTHRLVAESSAELLNDLGLGIVSRFSSSLRRGGV